jgi:hypothetical protein
MLMSETRQITSSMINFFKQNVLSVTDLTRSNKLSEILDSYANKKSEEIFLVQNARNRDALGAIIDVDLLQELLTLREAVSQAADRIVEQMAIERVDTFKPDISLAQALHEAEIEDIDVETVLKLSAELEI